MIELIGVVASVLAVVGVVLNNRRMICCFYLWMVSNSLSLGLHVYAAVGCGAEVWSLVARDAVFLVLAFHGLKSWGKLHHEGTKDTKLKNE